MCVSISKDICLGAKNTTSIDLEWHVITKRTEDMIASKLRLVFDVGVVPQHIDLLHGAATRLRAKSMRIKVLPPVYEQKTCGNMCRHPSVYEQKIYGIMVLPPVRL